MYNTKVKPENIYSYRLAEQSMPSKLKPEDIYYGIFGAAERMRLENPSAFQTSGSFNVRTFLKAIWLAALR